MYGYYTAIYTHYGRAPHSTLHQVTWSTTTSDKFIYCLLNDALNNSHYMAQNGEIISE
jgi:hypothetical protein